MKQKAKKIFSVFTVCLPVFTYLVWIGVYYWLLEGGRYRAFMQPKLLPLLILALILLLFFGVSFIFKFAWQHKGPGQTDAWLRAGILFVPALFLWTVYGQSLGAHALTKKTFDADEMISIPQTPTEQPSTPDSSVIGVSLLELLKNLENLEGKYVATEGMVFRSNTASENGFKIFRFVIFCCAADALPLWLHITSVGAGNLENETWVSVEGKLEIEKINGRQVPHIKAKRVQVIPTPAPEKQYLFFY